MREKLIKIDLINDIIKTVDVFKIIKPELGGNGPPGIDSVIEEGKRGLESCKEEI